MPMLLPVRPGTVTEEERARLRGEGVILVEHTTPGELVLPNAGADLPALLADFVSRLATSLPGYRISVTGTVTATPAAILGGGGGPPLNADGNELPPPRAMRDNPQLVGYTHGSAASADLWVFVAVLSTATATSTTLSSAGVIAYPLPSSVARTAAPAAWSNNSANYSLTAYRLPPGGSLSWQTPPQSPATVVWSRQAQSNE